MEFCITKRVAVKRLKLSAGVYVFLRGERVVGVVYCAYRPVDPWVVVCADFRGGFGSLTEANHALLRSLD